MTNAEFIKELERRWNVNESLYASGQIVQKKYEANQVFFKKIAQTIERNVELEIDAIPDLQTETFIKSFLRELDSYGLRAIFTRNNEVRILKSDLTAYNE